MPARYQRILLKLSGEILAGEGGHGINEDVIGGFADEIRDVHALGVQIGIVLGGGNIFRGLAASGRGMDRVAADHMGMLATVINSLALQHFLEHRGIYTRVMSAVEMNRVCEAYIRRRAVRHLEKGRVVILAAGTGNPYFTTDTAAALRAVEGPLASVRGEAPETIEYPGAAQALPRVWIALRGGLRSVLERVTLADIASGELPPEIERLAADPEAWITR